MSSGASVGTSVRSRQAQQAPRGIIHHQSPLRQIVRQVVEDVLSYLTLVVDEQLRVVALSLWKLGYALVGQLVIVFANMYVFRFHAAKVAKN